MIHRCGSDFVYGDHTVLAVHPHETEEDLTSDFEGENEKRPWQCSKLFSDIIYLADSL